MSVLRLYLSSVLLLVSALAHAGDLEVAWLHGETVSTPTQFGASDVNVPRRPLGSLWKLFVYAYAIDNNVPTPTYRCAAPRRPGEEHCCEPAQSVERDAALLKSCGLFFEPQRLGISEHQWRNYWRERVGEDAKWLVELKALQPSAQVSVSGILHAVQAIAPDARAAAERALMPMTISGFAKGKAGPLGGMLRVKTFTFGDPQAPNALIGGGAGWLVDGTPIWFSANGNSKSVLKTHAQSLAEVLPELTARNAIDASCVVVDYFDRYPATAVDTLPSGTAAPQGAMKGKYRVRFESGSTVSFSTSGNLLLDVSSGQPRIQGRHTLNDYVARVIDREANANETEAARALAVVIRTYVLQNAHFENGCYRIADSTRKQRVSVNDPSPAAQAIALFTDGLMLDAPNVRYHRDRDASGVLSWTTAMNLSRDGNSYEQILANTFPDAALAAISGERDCRRLPDVEAWYTKAVARWNRQLSNEIGFEPLSRAPSICALDTGVPYSDQERLRIYLRGLKTRDDRIALAHEYLHLAFRFHPRGDDEAFIEHTARKLAD